MTKAEAIHKAQRLALLAEGNANENEARCAYEIAAKLLAKFELTPGQVGDLKQKYPSRVTRRLRILLNQMIRCKMWLIYTSKHVDLAAPLARMQAELESMISKSEALVFRNRKRMSIKGQLHTRQRRYL